MSYFQDDGTVAAKAITIAAQQAGKPYVWGAGGPDAFDCSGLVHYCYRMAGLPGVGSPTSHSWVTASIRFMGDAVAYGQEQPGDLVMPTAGHVGIVIGNGQMWNAPETGIPVKVSTYGKPFAIRRVSTPSNNSATGGINATTAGFITTGITDPFTAIWDAIKSINDTLTGVGNAISSFDNAIKWLLDGHNIIRIMEVLGGSVMLYLATKVD